MSQSFEDKVKQLQSLSPEAQARVISTLQPEVQRKIADYLTQDDSKAQAYMQMPDYMTGNPATAYSQSMADQNGEGQEHESGSVWDGTRPGLRFSSIIEGSGQQQFMSQYSQTPDYRKTLEGAAQRTYAHQFTQQYAEFKGDPKLNPREAYDATNNYFKEEGISAQSILQSAEQNWQEAQGSFSSMQSNEPISNEAKKQLGILLASATRNLDTLGYDVLNPNNIGGKFEQEFAGVGGGWATDPFQRLAKEHVNRRSISAPAHVTKPAERQEYERRLYGKMVGAKATQLSQEYNEKARGMAHAFSTNSWQLGQSGLQKTNTFKGSYADLLPPHVQEQWATHQGMSKAERAAKRAMKKEWADSLKGYNASIGIGGNEQYKENQLGLSGSNSSVRSSRRAAIEGASFVTLEEAAEYRELIAASIRDSGGTGESVSDATAVGGSVLTGINISDDAFVPDSGEFAQSTSSYQGSSLQSGVGSFTSTGMHSSKPASDYSINTSRPGSFDAQGKSYLYSAPLQKSVGDNSLSSQGVLDFYAQADQGMAARYQRARNARVRSGATGSPRADVGASVQLLQQKFSPSSTPTPPQGSKGASMLPTMIGLSNKVSGENWWEAAKSGKLGTPQLEAMAAQAAAQRASGDMSGAQQAGGAFQDLLRQDDNFFTGQVGDVSYGAAHQDIDSEDWLDARLGLWTATNASATGADQDSIARDKAYDLRFSKAMQVGRTPEAELERMREANLSRPGRSQFELGKRLRTTGETDIEAGKRLEGIANRALADRIGADLTSVGLVTNANMRLMGASPDALYSTTSDQGLVETKSVRHFKAPSEDYIDQMQMQMAVTGSSHAIFNQIMEDEQGNLSQRHYREDANPARQAELRQRIEEGQGKTAAFLGQLSPAELSDLPPDQRAKVAEYLQIDKENKARATRERVQGNVEESQGARRSNILEDVERNIQATKPTSTAERNRRERDLARTFSGMTEKEAEVEEKRFQRAGDKHADAIIMDNKRTSRLEEDDKKQQRSDAKLQREVNTAFLAVLQSGSVGGMGGGIVSMMSGADSSPIRAAGGLIGGAIAGLSVGKELAGAVSNFTDMAAQYGVSTYGSQGSKFALSTVSGMSEQGVNSMQGGLLKAQLMMKKGHAQYAAALTDKSQGLVSIEDVRDLGDQPIALIKNALAKGRLSGWDEGKIRANLEDAFPEAGKLLTRILEEERQGTGQLDKFGGAEGEDEAALLGRFGAQSQQSSLTGKDRLLYEARKTGTETAGALGTGTEGAIDATQGLILAGGVAAASGASYAAAKGYLGKTAQTVASKASPVLGTVAKGLGKLAMPATVGMYGYEAYKWGANAYNRFEHLTGGELNEENTADDRDRIDSIFGEGEYDKRTQERARAASKEASKLEQSGMKRVKVEDFRYNMSNAVQAPSAHAAQQRVAVDVNLNINNKSLDAELTVDGETRARQSSNNNQLGRVN